MLKIFDIDANEKGYIEKLKNILVDKNIKNIILTLGKNGSLLLNKEKCEKFDAYKVKAIDTTAAGDSFIAAFAKKILEGNDVSLAIKYATLVSAIVVTRKGAQDSIPSLEEIEKFKNNLD